MGRLWNINKEICEELSRQGNNRNKIKLYYRKMKDGQKFTDIILR